jgi:5'(3')-deoxyribonucleotidase
MKVACDFDGCLANSHQVALDLINFKHGTTYKYEDVTSWNWWKENGVEEDFWAVYDLFDTTYLRRAIPPTSPLAAASMKWLQKRGHECEIVTSNRQKSVPTISAWLFGHGIDFPVRSIDRISASEKAKLDYDLFIDDAPHLAEAISAMLEKTLILVDQPWNRGVRGSNVWRMQDWGDAIHLFKMADL